ncbi:MAG: hypothetical protein WKF73_14720 [Nocardioidaceae bacterium]
MSEAASLRPVVGPPREVEALLRRWLEDDDPPPLSVRTSGSTGAPKDVLLSAEALRGSALATLGSTGWPGAVGAGTACPAGGRLAGVGALGDS